MLKQSEIDNLTTYLCKLFNCAEMVVLQHPEEDNQALVAKGQEFFARLERDDDEGELSYNFSKDIPDRPHDELNAYVKVIFNTTSVEVRKRPNKSDSAEIYKGDEFLGVLYDDDGNSEGMQIFNMAILDIDLDDLNGDE
ncbi:MAG: DUF3126 family protein [Rhizobiaceae bacterium]